jgi:pimeloyl-ACP methyl ester carboxylesterase
MPSLLTAVRARAPLSVLVVAALVAMPGPAGAHSLAVRGLRMYYDVRGKGPTLVLLHGGGGSGLQFEKQVPAFETSHRLVIPDMCAQGRTTDRPGPLSYHAMAEDVIALMDHLHIHKFDLMGWSDGGMTGLDLAIHHPGRLRHLVTFGANFTPEGLREPDRAWLDTATVAGFGDDMRKGWQALSPEPDHYAEAMTKLIQMWRTQPNFTAAELGSIRARTMVCAGENDLVRREHTQTLARAIPRSSLWIVPGATHGAMLEKPDEVNAKVLAFLSR